MSPKILIVDDEQEALDAIRRTIQKDFDVLQAHSADEALEILKKTSDIAVIMSDERMPNKTGTRFLSEIKVLYPKIVRVILSGQIELPQMMDAVNKAEVHRFILKPWENHVLRLQLQEALVHHRDLEEMIKLQKLAITDAVTGLTNHRFFQERIREELERSSRHHHRFSLIMIDVDHFKSYNDKNGHPEGDKALAQLANLLKTATRTEDSVSRYGGDEFAIVLPETSKKAAEEAASRIRRDLPSITPLTLSFGIASYPDDGKNADAIVTSADRALYKAKTNGRNRIELAP